MIACVVFAGVSAMVIVMIVSGATQTPMKPVAAVGAPCNGRHAACAADQKALLVCGPDDKMVVSETCKGPNACRPAPDGKSVKCDDILADLGDVCTGDTEACSTDHKAELRCQGGHFALIATCKGPDGCTFTPAKQGGGFTLSCDDHVADVGDPCFDSDRTACSSDKKAFLICTAQRFAVEHPCKQGCTTRKIAGTDKVEMTCK